MQSGEHKIPNRYKAAAVVVWLLIWQAAAMMLGRSFLLASPLQTLSALVSLLPQASFWSAAAFSLLRITGGFLLGLAAGLLLAFLCARFPLCEAFFWPVMTCIRSVPVASFIVLALLWLRAANLSVFISFLIVLPVVYTNVLGALKTADVRLLQMAKVFRLSAGKRLVYIDLPAIRSALLAACSAGIGFAWKSGVAAEVIGIPSGSIGERLYYAKVYLSSPELLAWTVVIVCCSALLARLLLALVRLFYRRLEAR